MDRFIPFIVKHSETATIALTIHSYFGLTDMLKMLMSGVSIFFSKLVCSYEVVAADRTSNQPTYD